MTQGRLAARSALIAVASLITALAFSAEPLPPHLQRLVARGHIESIAASGDTFTLKLGPRFHDAPSDRQEALLQHLLHFVSLAYPTSRTLIVQDTSGRRVRTLDAESVRTARAQD